jgi:hypothetical protein
MLDDSKDGNEDGIDDSENNDHAEEGPQLTSSTSAAPSDLSRQSDRMVGTTTQPGMVAVAGLSNNQGFDRLEEKASLKQEEKVEEQFGFAVANPISAEVLEQEEVARAEIAATKAKLDEKLNELETMAERLAEMDLMRKELDALRSKVATAVPAEATRAVAVEQQQDDRKVEPQGKTKQRRPSLVDYTDREIDALHILLGHNPDDELPKKVAKEPKKMAGKIMPKLTRLVSSDDVTEAGTVSPDNAGSPPVLASEAAASASTKKDRKLDIHSEGQLESEGCCIIL